MSMLKTDEPVDSASISNQIQRILQSQTFANKSQLRKLLEILHKNFDSQPSLKPDGVIRELWPDETRTKRAADVATEMNRLRHALESFYNGEGKNDPILITLPSRSAAVLDGRHEKRWIAACPRDASETAEEHPPAPAASKRPRILAWTGVAVAVLASAAYWGLRLPAGRSEPKSARMEGSALVILNAEGKELWRKSFPDGFGPDSYYTQGLTSRLWFADLEGKGHPSVLFSYLPAASSEPHSSTLICYSDRGKEKWRWTPGRALPEIAGEPPTFKTFSFGVLKATDKRALRIVVLNNHDPWWGGPSQVAVLDSNGKFLSEYWHSGGFRDMVQADLDGDGRQEIILTGVAHGYDSQATLVVLDSDHVSGASKEIVPAYQIRGMGDAHERMRLLFPRSDLNRASFQFSLAVEPVVHNGNLRLNVLECLAPLGCPIAYEFNRDFRLVAAHAANDEFRSAHDRYYQNGKDAHPLSAEELASFLRVRCLAGCKSELVPVAETYSPAASFEKGWAIHRNPEGVWSYGYSSGFVDPVTLYDKTVQNGINGPNAQYWLSSSVNVGTSPAAEYNHGPSYNDGNIDFLANEFLLVAGIRGQYSDLIFTAPAGGEYSIDGNFRGAQYLAGTVVGIVADGTLVFHSSISSVEQIVPFSLKADLRAGSKVVFSVGPGSGGQNTGLSATITRPCALTDIPAFTPAGEISCSNAQPVNRKAP
jgi:hypothetical protein